MYKEKISRYIDAHKKEMLEDIEELCRINSVKGSTGSENRMGRDVPRHCAQRCISRNVTIFPSTIMTIMSAPWT